MGKDILETTSTRAVQIILSMVTSVIIARSLGVSGRGEFALAMSVGALLAQFGNLGLHASNTYFVAQNRDRYSALLANTVAVSLVFGSIIGASALAVKGALPHLLPLTWLAALLIVPWVPLALFTTLGQHLLIGLDLIRSYNATELVQRIATTALILLVVLFGQASPEAFIFASLTALSFTAALVVRPLRRKFPSGRLRTSRALFLTTLRYGMRAYGASLGAFLLLKVDLLMVGSLLPLRQTGLYSVATAMIDLFQTLPVIVGSLLFPKLSAIETRSTRWTVARSSAAAVGLTMTVLSVLAAMLGRWAISLLYGSEFAGAATSFTILLPGTVLLSINIILNQYFAASGMPPVTFIAPLLGLALNVALNLLLTPHLGINGAAAASSIAYASMLLSSLIALRRSPSLHTGVVQ